MRRRFTAIVTATLLACASAAINASPTVSKKQEHQTPCQLTSAQGAIRHVIYIQFDNTHFTRDNPNVPSDLEQMPHLLNFLQDNGTVSSNHYTILISHTAGGILSSLTGLYPDRHGITVSNSYDYYRPTLLPTFSSAFKYWTDPVASPDDSKPNMVFPNEDTGAPQTAPAPWVSYTRAGCDFGAVSTANVVLENTGLSAANGDVYKVFGPGSPEFIETTTKNGSPSAKVRAQPQAEYVGIAIHCGLATPCASDANAKADLLADEPGGYLGFNALFGAKYVNQAICAGSTAAGCVMVDGSPAVKDTAGAPIQDPQGNAGFPGFDGMPAAVTLGYVAQMQEAGIPVTYAYISDVHDNHSGGGAYGPGEAGYVAALKKYDDAFAAFFERLKADGIDKTNTLFVFTADENDHYAGQMAQNCDGVNTPCVYHTAAGNPAHGIFDVSNGGITPWNGPTTWPPATQNGPLVGEMGYNLKWAGLMGATINGTGYDISFDSAPSFYINGQLQAVDASGNVVVNSTLRAFEQKAANLKAFDPYIDATQLTPVARYLVDAPTLKALHMINADPQRTMSFTMFAEPDYYFQTFSPCPSPSQGCLNDGFAWIHGDYSQDIGRTWLGMVGPGVKNDGVNGDRFSDHTDIRPTIMSLVGLKDDYTPDGRVLAESLFAWAVPQTLRAHRETLLRLGDTYKQLNAPYADFAHSLIVASTKGIKSSDSAYLAMEQSIQRLTAQRDALVSQIRAALNAAAFDDTAINEKQAKDWIDSAEALLADAALLGM